MKSDSVHIGVDVSKAKLDVYVPAKQEGLRATTFEVANDVAGFRRLRDVARSANATVCVEPTGVMVFSLDFYRAIVSIPRKMDELKK
jgi:transposase